MKIEKKIARQEVNSFGNVLARYSSPSLLDVHDGGREKKLGVTSMVFGKKIFTDVVNFLFYLAGSPGLSSPR